MRALSTVVKSMYTLALRAYLTSLSWCLLRVGLLALRLNNRRGTKILTSVCSKVGWLLLAEYIRSCAVFLRLRSS